MEGIMKIVKSFQDSGLLLKEVSLSYFKNGWV